MHNINLLGDTQTKAAEYKEQLHSESLMKSQVNLILCTIDNSTGKESKTSALLTVHALPMDKSQY